VKAILKALAHRLRQARAVALRAELAVTGAQILFWLALIGVLAGLALRLLRRRRQTPAQQPSSAETTPAVAAD
jgi:LPXTG-motif cell wall-anchored protein